MYWVFRAQADWTLRHLQRKMPLRFFRILSMWFREAAFFSASGTAFSQEVLTVN
jgi:hypothetical protein